jgi:uncharacterized protein YcbK (DUF882 family)
MLVQEYFLDSELDCDCGCGKMSRRGSVERLYALRLLYGKRVVVVSGARCEKRNKLVGGALDSAHLQGGGFDIVVPNDDELRVIFLAHVCGFTGIGVRGNGMLHVDDVHGVDAVWVYPAGG